MANIMDGVFEIGDIHNTPFKLMLVAASDRCVGDISLHWYLKGSKTVRVDLIHKLIR